MTDLAIVIVNYNTRDLLQQALDSIFREITLEQYEVFVVDNHSIDGSVQMVKTCYPRVKLLENRTNTGFSIANNQAIRESRSRYIMLLNSDTILLPGSVEALIQFLDETPEAATVGAKLVGRDGNVQATAKAFPTLFNSFFAKKSLLTKWFPNNPLTKRTLVCMFKDQERPFEVDLVSGAGMLIRRQAFQDVGEFDESFYMYWEDVDWCRRAVQKKWKVFYHPQAPIVHLEGGSSQKEVLRLVVEYHRSVYMYFRKHHYRSLWHPLNFVTILGLVLHAGFVMLGRGKKGELSSEG